MERAEPESVGLSAERLARVGALVKAHVSDGTIAGGITLVARRQRIAHLECTGLMDIEQDKPMREDAIFRIYSMTKIITSAAVLMLLEEGRFLLRDPVSRFLPEFRDLRVAVKGADGEDELVRPRREVTIHDLLTHLSGFSYDFVFEARELGLNLAAFVPELCKRPLQHHPGQTWLYGASTDVLGRLIEVLSGCEFDVFLQDRVFGPLGMVDTGFFVPPDKVERLARVYEPDDDGALICSEDTPTRPYLSRPVFLSGGGGLVSTTSDYLRFAQMMLNGGEFHGVRLLGRKTVELMRHDHLPPGHPPLEVNNRGFGLGVSVVRSLGEVKQVGSVGEFGWGGAACTQVWIDPAEEMISMIMLQHRPREKFPLLDEFKQTAYQAIVD
jgi:CubicO group peptidase (beta-lactamase class C family)